MRECQFRYDGGQDDARRERRRNETMTRGPLADRKASNSRCSMSKFWPMDSKPAEPIRIRARRVEAKTANSDPCNMN